MPGIKIRTADWKSDFDMIRRVREAVFIREQQVDPAIEWDDLEETAQHFLAIRDSEPLATGRITPGGKVGRIAVVKSARRNGLGLRLLQFICDYARRELGLDKVYLHAQCQAENFYRKAGFTAEGEPFIEADIPHIKMVLTFD